MEVRLEDCRTSRMPDGDDCHFGWSIKRAGTDGPLKLIVISSDIFGIRTHYHRGRTGPCLVKGCHCEESKQLSRWKGYLLCFEMPSKNSVVFEFTPPGAQVLDECRKEYGTLRGVKLVATRSSKRPNAKVVLTIAGRNLAEVGNCPDVAVWPIVARIWGIASIDKAEVVRGDLDDLSGYERAA